MLRHPTETATQRGPFRAKDTASQSIWITAGTVEGEYCSEDVGFWSTWLCRADTQIWHCQIVGIDAYAAGVVRSYEEARRTVELAASLGLTL